MGVLAEDRAEDERADAQRMLHGEREADAIAGEAAEPCAVVILNELGARLEQRRDLRNLKRDHDGERDHAHAD